MSRSFYHLLFIHVDGRVVTLVGGRDMQMTCDPEEKLRALPDQFVQPNGRLGDEARLVGIFVVGFQRPGEWGMKEDNRREVPVSGEQRSKPSEPYTSFIPKVSANRASFSRRVAEKALANRPSLFVSSSYRSSWLPAMRRSGSQLSLSFLRHLFYKTLSI